jgi:hypothetical protein
MRPDTMMTGAGPAADLKCWAKRSASIVAEVTMTLRSALVRLVDDERVVGLEQRVGLRLGQQDAVGHELDRGVARQAVLEAHLEADDIAQRRFQLFGNALGDRARSDAARLRVADEPAPALGRIALAPAQRQRDLGQLRGLARARLAAHDDDLVGRDGRHDFFAPAGDGQRFGKVQRERRRGARCRGVGHRNGGRVPRGTSWRIRDYPSAESALPKSQA